MAALSETAEDSNAPVTEGASTPAIGESSDVKMSESTNDVKAGANSGGKKKKKGKK